MKIKVNLYWRVLISTIFIALIITRTPLVNSQTIQSMRIEPYLSWTMDSMQGRELQGFNLYDWGHTYGYHISSFILLDIPKNAIITSVSYNVHTNIVIGNTWISAYGEINSERINSPKTWPTMSFSVTLGSKPIGHGNSWYFFDSTMTNLVSAFLKYEGSDYKIVTIGLKPGVGETRQYLDVISFYNDEYLEIKYVLDTEGPIISSITYNPKEPKTNQNVQIEAKIIDELSGVKDVHIKYKEKNVNQWNSIPMSKKNENTYYGEIPSFTESVDVEYFIDTYDECGNKRASNIYSYSISKPAIPSFNLVSILLGILTTSLFKMIKYDKE